jgi:hypothetical protein
MDEELQFHIATRAELFMRQGLSREAAMDEALRRLGVRPDVDLDAIRRSLRQSANLFSSPCFRSGGRNIV